METWKPRDRGMGHPQVCWCEKVTRSLNDAVSRPEVQIVDDSLLDGSRRQRPVLLFQIGESPVPDSIELPQGALDATIIVLRCTGR